jgi:hypothetical protein
MVPAKDHEGSRRMQFDIWRLFVRMKSASGFRIGTLIADPL